MKKLLKNIKWGFILSFLFIFTVLAMPFFCVAVWANTEQTQYFLQLFSKSIAKKYANDVKGFIRYDRN